MLSKTNKTWQGDQGKIYKVRGGGGGGEGGEGGEGGVSQNIMRTLCAVIRPDHFKFASYGPAHWKGHSWSDHIFPWTTLEGGLLRLISNVG